MSALPDILHQPIQALLEEGDKFFDKGKLDAALLKYEEARALLPSETERWEASTWVLAAIGDASFLLADFAGGHAALSQALRCPEGADNAFILLRLGQCEFELGRPDSARQMLSRAFAVGGDEVFEDEDPKYLALVDA
ncbi:tetratricopeptide repeat protein [Chitinimonas arctica]|uniref:Tetratricopeptide repeat protein n=1 Tax=Chitinimonas arctica TaxID=2594795 RepID=A0A516SFC9_9NEIS|nr:tetratricopeptide repeat protein [Chitinimonas arctica]QDQ26810.1 tetratricopeptide repeat protein [Chitinimonas arctica]